MSKEEGSITKTKVHADIRVSAAGIEAVDLAVPLGHRADAFLWLERALPALRALDQVVKTIPRQQP